MGADEFEARRTAGGRLYRTLLLAAVAMTPMLGGLVAVPCAVAQETTVRIDIPAGPLTLALTRLATQARMQIGFDSTIVAGKQTPGVSGAYTPREALSALLAGTGLTFDLTSDLTATIRPAAGGAAAADQSAGEGIQIPTLVVDGGSGGVINAQGYVALSTATGSKTDTPVVEVPQSVSTVTEAQIRDRNPQNLREAIAYTPNVRVNAYGTDPRFDSFFVRGFNLTNTGVFRDNLRQPTGGYGYFLTEPYAIEGISILRGPSSALYGATGAGGLYNVISRRPSAQRQQEIGLQLGSYNRYQAQFDLTGPVDDDGEFLYRLTGLGRLAQTEYASVDDDKFLIAPAFTWRPQEGTRLTLLTEYSRSQTGGNPAYYNDRYGHVTRLEAGDPAFSELDHRQWRIGWEFEHAIDSVFTLRQNARYSQQNIDAKYVYTYNGAAHAANPLLIDRGTGYEINTLDAFVIDNQMQARFATGEITHTVLAGLDVTWSRYDASSGYGTAPPLSMLSLNYGGFIATPALTAATRQEQVQAGLYLQDQIRYGGWTLTVGGRHDWLSTDTDNTDLTSGARTSLNQTERAWSGRIGLTYQTEFGLVPYASLSTAFSPNIGVNATTRAPFEPTTSTQQEIGVRYVVPGTNAMLTAALFNIDQNNGLFYQVVDGINTQVQRGRLRSRGVELEAVASLDNGVSFTAAYSYTDLRIKEGTEGTVGNAVSSVPFHLASAWTYYAPQEGELFHGLLIGAGARYIGRSYGDDTNTITNGARVLFDAVLGFDLSAIGAQYNGFRLQVNASNIFNRRDTTCTGGYCYIDSGRFVVGTLAYRW